MTETEEIVKILDHIASRIKPIYYQSGASWILETNPPITIRRHGNSSELLLVELLIEWKPLNGEVFRVVGLSPDLLTGFKLLERLAEYPWIAAKLAEPMK